MGVARNSTAMDARVARRRARPAVVWLEGAVKLLAAAALSAGLARARPRSAATRLTWECERFVKLLVVALGPHSTRALEDAVEGELRVGSLACASSLQIGRVFAVWRRVMEALAGNLEERRSIIITLQRLEETAKEGLDTVRRTRADLVIIGGSAGSIPPLLEIIGQLSPDMPATALIVLHMSASRPSLAAKILGRSSRIPVVPAIDGGALLLGHAFVALPDRHLGLRAGRMALCGGPLVNYVRPALDHLLEDAARGPRRHVVAAVLSGTGLDGARGVRVIHARGGTVLAQDPRSTTFNGMPEAAIRTGCVHRILPARGLGRMIEGLATNGRAALDEEADA